MEEGRGTFLNKKLTSIVDILVAAGHKESEKTKGQVRVAPTTRDN
jgi:hypothetical protein